MPDTSVPDGDPRNRVEQMICCWAEATYGLESVTDVAFDFKDDVAWSDETPSDGPYMNVTITHLNGQQQYASAVYDTTLIRDILKFALDAQPTATKGTP